MGTATITATADGISTSCIITVTAPVITVQDPQYSVIASSATDRECYAVLVFLTNKGTEPIRIFSSGSRLSDNTYYAFDRNLKLFDSQVLEEQNRLVYLNYIDVMPGESKYISWAVQGSSTWYDYKSTIIFDFSYTGVMYINKTSYYRGSTYQVK